jgi:YD repeat-containing protein
MFLRLRMVAVATTVFVCVSSVAAAQNPFKHQGLDAAHAPDSAMPNESVDPASGTLTIVETDLALPGNAGYNLAIQRVYNSAVYPDYDSGGSTALEEDSWAGVGWRLHFGRILHSDSTSAGQIQVEMGDGSRHPLYHSMGNPNIWTTSDFWQYNPATHKLLLPNGLVYTFDREVYINDRLGTVRYVTDIRDPFNNWVTLSYFDAPGPIDGIQQIRQYLSPTQIREINFTYDSTYNSLRTMTYGSHVWTYDHNPTGPAGYSLLVAVHAPPTAPAYSYDYAGTGAAQELTTLHTLFGGAIQYTYADSVRRAGAYTTTTRVVTQRTLSGHDVAAGSTTTFAYGTGTNHDTTVVTTPCGGLTRYRFDGTGDSADFTGWRAGTLVDITVEEGAATLEHRTLSYVRSEPISPDPITGPNGVWNDDAVYRPLLSQLVITRGPQSWTTTNTYHTGLGNFNDYGQPYSIDERESIYRGRTTTLNFQTGFTPYILGRVHDQTITEQIAFGVSNGTTTGTFGYDLATGFLMNQTVRGTWTAFDPRPDGNVGVVWDVLGHQTATFGYDWGRVSSIHTPHLDKTFVITEEGLVASETVGTLTTTYDYDGAFRLRGVHPPATNPVALDPDDLHGTFIRVTQGASVVYHMIDAFGRELEAHNTVGLHTQQFRDLCGRVTFVSDPYTTGLGTQGTTVALDALGRAKQVTDSAGKVTTYAYNGAAVTRTDANNHSTGFGYYVFGDPSSAKLASVTDADGHVTEYQYDVTGPLRKVTGPSPGLLRTWVINGHGLPDSDTQPESGTTSYTYDALDNLKTITDAETRVTTLNYDENNRLISRDAPGTADDITSIVYDANGRVGSITGGGTTTTYGYTFDSPNRKITTTRTDTTGVGTFASTYLTDAIANLETITYPSGRVVTYHYDAENRLTSIDQKPAGAPSSSVFANAFTYGGNGRLESYVTGAVTQHFTYEAERPKRIWTTGGSDALDLTYTYDNVGNVTAIADPRPGASQSFTMDVLDRLYTANGPWGSLAWTYDNAGNRLTESAPAITTYSYNAATQRLMSTTGAVNESFTYNNAGQLTQDAMGAYSYSQAGKLLTFTGGGVTASYANDTAGERFAHTVNGHTTYTLRSLTGETLSEYAAPCGAPVWSRDVIYAIGRPIGAIKAVVATPTVSLASATVSVGESAASVNVPVVITTPGGAALACAVTVSYHTTQANGGPRNATEGSDYAGHTGTVTFPAGTASGATQNATVTPLDDQAFEGDETFYVDLSTATGAALSGTTRATVTIRDNDPRLVIDTPAPNAVFLATLSAGGWAVDPTPDTGTGVDAVKLDARPAAGGATTFLGTLTYGGARSDIGTLFGARFTNSGYSGAVYDRLRPGSYDLIVSGRRTQTTLFDVSGTVLVSTTALAVDTPLPNAHVNWTFPVGGWAVNPAAASGPGVTSVTLAAYDATTNQLLQTATTTYGGDRPDIASAYGAPQFEFSGYSTMWTFAPGLVRIDITSNDASGAIETTSRTVTVVPSNPQMSIDAPATNSTVTPPFTVGGWAIDLNAPSGTGVDAVHVWSFRNGDPTQAHFEGVATYGAARPDVGGAYGAQFTNSGYNLTIASLAAGSYQINVYAHSTVAGAFNLVRTISVTVQ